MSKKNSAHDTNNRNNIDLSEKSHSSDKRIGKKARKKIKKRLIWYSFKDFIKEWYQEQFEYYFLILSWDKRMKRSLEYTRKLMSSDMIYWWNIVTDFTIGSLDRIDKKSTSNLMTFCKDEGIPYNENMIWGWYEGLGSYFGEVIIRNLGGIWEFPPRELLRRARRAKNLSIFYDQFYVNINGNRIPVIKVARLKLDGSGEVQSLRQAYEQIASTGRWSDFPRNFG